MMLSDVRLTSVCRVHRA